VAATVGTGPPPTRTRRWRPLAVAAGAAAAVTWVGAVDPERPGHYPTCPFLSLTGLWCPGCGSLRAVHALAHGDLSTAVSRNVLTVAAIPLLIGLWAGWARRTWTGSALRDLAHPAVLWSLLAGVVAFWVLRNLPVGSWLAP
jgi:hypothetical protein